MYNQPIVLCQDQARLSMAAVITHLRQSTWDTNTPVQIIVPVNHANCKNLCSITYLVNSHTSTIICRGFRIIV